MVTFSFSCLAIFDFVCCITSSCPDLMADSEYTPPPLKRKPRPSHFDDSWIQLFQGIGDMHDDITYDWPRLLMVSLNQQYHRKCIVFYDLDGWPGC